MALRVELTEDAEADLEHLATSGMIKAFLAKLIKLEEDGVQVGRPLGRGLTNWRKIVVGDRQWRIVFLTDSDETVATVWVMRDRDDEECYREAERRLKRAEAQSPATRSLAAALADIIARKSARKHKR